MLKERYIKVTLTDEEKSILLKSAEILDELYDEMGEAISNNYPVYLEDLRDTLRGIAYESTFEINE